MSVTLRLRSSRDGVACRSASRPAQGLVRVDGRVGGPAAEQAPLLGDGQGAGVVAAGPASADPGGGIGEDQAAGPGPAEERPEGGQPPGPACRAHGEECLQVGSLDGGPVGLGLPAGEEAGQVPQDGQVVGEGAIGARAGAGSPGSLLGGGQGGGVAGHGLSQRLRGFFDAALAACGLTAGGVVYGEGEPGVGEEVLQGPGEGSGRPARPGRLLQDRLRGRRARLGEQPAQAADHQRGPPDAVAGGSMRGEAGQPGRRVIQPDGQPLDLAGEPGRVLLPAVVAQSVRDDDRQLPAGLAGTGRLGPAVAAAAPRPVPGPDYLAANGAGPRAGGAPAGSRQQQPAAAAARAGYRLALLAASVAPGALPAAKRRAAACAVRRI